MVKSSFNKDSEILTQKFSKRVIYDREQFYDIKVGKVNERFDIEISSSQLTKAYIAGDKEHIQQLIDDLQEAINL